MFFLYVLIIIISVARELPKLLQRETFLLVAVMAMTDSVMTISHFDYSH